MRSPTVRHALGLLVALGLVHAAGATGVLPVHAQTPHRKAQNKAPTNAETKPAQSGALPSAAAEMREAILEAVQSGRLEDLKAAADLNELKPELAAGAVPDPIEFWRQQSGDGTGAALLARIGALLDGPYAVVPLGKDAENNRQFIWPAFAEKPLTTLTEAEQAQLKRFEPDDKIAAMLQAGKYLGWRIVIGADGVWHAFRRFD